MAGRIAKSGVARIFRLQDILPGGGDAGSSADMLCFGLQLGAVGQQSVCHGRGGQALAWGVVCCSLQAPRRSESMAWGSRHPFPNQPLLGRPVIWPWPVSTHENWVMGPILARWQAGSSQAAFPGGVWCRSDAAIPDSCSANSTFSRPMSDLTAPSPDTPPPSPSPSKWPNSPMGGTCTYTRADGPVSSIIIGLESSCPKLADSCGSWRKAHTHQRWSGEA